MSHAAITNKQTPDQVLIDIADYVADFSVENKEAFNTARNCLIDTLGCGLEALSYPACTKLLGPVVPGTIVPNGARVPGTNYQLDPINAAFNIGTMIRWLDFNDTWLAAEWGHPSDNLGGILAVADWLSRTRLAKGEVPLLMKDVLEAMIKAHEIQGVIALDNSFNRVGLDHVVLVKVASTAVVAKLLGASKQQIVDALSNAWLDGQSLRTYRHAPNTGSRKSWAAGDATSRAVKLALMTMQGEMGYPTALTAKTWGFYDVLFKGKSFSFQRDFGSYVMENVLFKISFPAEFHAQTAVECALTLHEKERDKLDTVEKIAQIDRIVITTHESQDYEDKMAQDPRVDLLREKMVCQENKKYTEDYLDPEKRSIANAIQIFYLDGVPSEQIAVEYPIGHKRRREEGIPKLVEKFKRNLAREFDVGRVSKILAVSLDQDKLESMPVNEYVDLYWQG